MDNRYPSGMVGALGSLADWFGRQKRVLPWRDEPTLYRVWISEIMLQQTQVVSVVPYFERFLARFPSVESLAAAPEEEVLRHWAGLGYYSRARNLHRGARLIVEEQGGRFPRTRDEWEAIPGVGPYTAGAILSIALNLPEAILDGNVERVLSRLRRVTRGRGDAAYKTRLWRLARIFVERGTGAGVKPSVLNQALMELGATICTPRSPKCLLCPVTTICRAAGEGDAEAYPPKRKRPEKIVVRESLYCLFNKKGEVLLRRRKPGEWRAGLWDLVEPTARRGEPLGKVQTRYVVTRHQVERTTEVWRVAEPGLADGEDLRWVVPPAEGEEPAVPVGAPLRRTLNAIRERFPEAWPKSSRPEPGSSR